MSCMRLPGSVATEGFSTAIGVLVVGMGALLSTIAWYYMMPVTAICILLAFALVDFLLYAVMKDVLVCYRCAASIRDSAVEEDHPRFNLEVAERYRQEQIRLKNSDESTFVISGVW